MSSFGMSVGALAVTALAGAAHATLVAGWDFNSIPNTSGVVTNPNMILNSHGNANNAPGSRFLDSNANAGDTQVFTGTSINIDPNPTGTLNPPAMPAGTLNGQDLSMRYGTAGNSGRSYTFAWDNSGNSSTLLQLAMRFTSTGPSLIEVFSSSDGGSTFSATPIWTLDTVAMNHRNSTYRYYEFSAAGLDNVSTSALRMVFTWTNSSNTGNVRMDNLTITPTPGSLALLGLGGLAALRRRR